MDEKGARKKTGMALKGKEKRRKEQPKFPILQSCELKEKLFKVYFQVSSYLYICPQKVIIKTNIIILPHMCRKANAGWNNLKCFFNCSAV